jgi:hypothetical protein
MEPRDLEEGALEFNALAGLKRDHALGQNSLDRFGWYRHDIFTIPKNSIGG